MIPLPELSRRRRLLVLVICSSSLFIVGLDSTIVNIALPSIGRDLHASVAALRAGLHMLPMATMMALGAVVSSRILARRGARLPMLAAGVGLAVGGVLLSRLTVSSALGPMVIAFVVFGIGAGVVNAPITYTAVSGMPVTQAGVASGIASTSRQIGQCLGIAVTGSILAANLRGSPLRTGFVPASHAGWLLLAGCGVVVFVLGLVTTSQWALGTAGRTAATFESAEPRAQVMTR